MNVYLIINEYNLEHNIPPYLYIGSDTKDRMSISEYSGSSKLLSEDIDQIGLKNFSKYILWMGSESELKQRGVDSITDLERNIHLWYEVDTNPLFYNVVCAGAEFHTSGRAVYYRANDPNKQTFLLSIDDPRVISGEWVGRNTSKHISEDTREKLRRRPHPSEFMDWSLYLTGHKKKSNVNYKKPKSEKHKQSMRKPKVKRQCPHCSMLCAPNVLDRHIKSAHGVV